MGYTEIKHRILNDEFEPVHFFRKVVLDLPIDNIADHFELHVALECFVTSSLAGHLNKDQISRLEANLDEQQTCVENNSMSRVVDLDSEFYVLLSSLLRNRKIQRVIQRIPTKHPDQLATNYPEHR